MWPVEGHRVALHHRGFASVIICLLADLAGLRFLWQFWYGTVHGHHDWWLMIVSSIVQISCGSELWSEHRQLSTSKDSSFVGWRCQHLSAWWDCGSLPADVLRYPLKGTPKLRVLGHTLFWRAYVWNGKKKGNENGIVLVVRTTETVRSFWHSSQERFDKCGRKSLGAYQWYSLGHCLPVPPFSSFCGRAGIGFRHRWQIELGRPNDPTGCCSWGYGSWVYGFWDWASFSQETLAEMSGNPWNLCVVWALWLG